MKYGRIIKLIGGQYTVLTDQNERLHVKPRGLFRHHAVSPKVGDLVTVEDTLITAVEPRKNDLERPPIANVDQAILIHAAREPEFSFNLLDRFLIRISMANVEAVIVVTKIDLLNEDELVALKEKLAYYAQYFDVHYTSVREPASLQAMEKLLAGKVSVFAGQTGAGKSSLLNAFDIRLAIEVGEISKALGRGRHTTRHVELLEVYGGLTADTPGFSKLDFTDQDIDNLAEHYPDFFARSHQCRFRGCKHLNEPGCAVKADLEAGKILRERYENYKLFHEEISQQKKKY